MRSRISPTHSLILVSALLLVPAVASAQSGTERSVEEAERQVEIAEGLVDGAVANRFEIEVELAMSISRLNDLSAELSQVGSSLDRLGDQLAFADVELAEIQHQIEVQAVEAYMKLVASPSVLAMATGSVEEALVATTVVDDVIADGQTRSVELYARRQSIEDLKQIFLAEQASFAAIKSEVDAEIEHLAELYSRADQAVADAVRSASAANERYMAELSALELARLKEEERQRQEARTPSTTTTSPGSTSSSTGSSSPTTGPPSTSPPPTTGGPTTTSPSTPPTTAPPGPTSTTTGGNKPGPWDTHQPTQQWRSLVEQYFPSSRVHEALIIIWCESRGDPNALNPWPPGAAGLFQFIPSTWDGLPSSVTGGTYASGQVFDPTANVRAAAWLANRYQQLGLYYWQAWSCKRWL